MIYIKVMWGLRSSFNSRPINPPPRRAEARRARIELSSYSNMVMQCAKSWKNRRRSAGVLALVLVGHRKSGCP